MHTAELIEKLPRKASRYLRRAKKNTDRPEGQSVFLVGEDGFPLTGINFDSIFRAKKNTDRPEGQSVFLVGEDGFPLTGINFDSIFRAKKNTDRPEGQSVFLVGEDGFEPSKALPADLQSVPFGHSGIPPYAILSEGGAGRRTRTPDLLITNQLLYQLSYTSTTPAYVS